MPLVNPVAMLRKARAGGYCIGAFNVVDCLSIEAVLAAAEARQAPVIIQTSSAVIKRFGVEKIVSMAREICTGSSVPVALHLDHGTRPEVIKAAIKAGYSSVMIDGSALPFEDNIAVTASVVAEAHASGVAVEGEIGVVAGAEDDIVINQDQAIYTTPGQAAEFQRRTGVDFLAPAIGTAHGFYTIAPRLDIDTLRSIRNQLDCPLVVHGGTGLTDDTIRELVGAGACKFNVSTQLKQTYIDSLFQYITTHRSEYNIIKVLDHAQQSLTDMIGPYLNILGSAGQAHC